MTLYLVQPDIKQREPDWNESSEWSAGRDLPDPAYWRTRPDGSEVPEKERWVISGEKVALVEITTTVATYYGIPLPNTGVHALRLVRLENDGTYTDLFQSDEYKAQVAAKLLTPYTSK